MSQRPVPLVFRIIPFALSWLRLPLAVLFLWFSAHRWAAVFILLLAALSDWLDGFLARRHGCVTFHGSLLDPAMDKVFVLIALLALLHHGYLKPYQALFVLSRDLFTGALIAVCYPWIRRRMEIKSRPLGKLVTNLQFATILAALLRFAVAPFAVVTLVVSLLSIVDYSWAFARSRQ